MASRPPRSSSTSPPARLPALRPRRLRRLLVGLPVIAVTALVAACGATAADPSPTDTSGAPATPDTAALAGELANQELAWEECEFTDFPPLPDVDLSNVECATITVPKNWLDPVEGETWDLRISYAHNIDVDDPNYDTTLIVHPGGPFSGLSFAATTQADTPELRPTTNYISYDQRGLGQSSIASCDYEYETAAGLLGAVKAIAESCGTDADVATMTSEQAAYDTDFIRHLLGLETVSYLGYSYGAMVGTWFGSLFADNVERIVFDSALNPTESYEVTYQGQNVGRDRQFQLHMMNYIARNDATYGLGNDPQAIYERYFAATASPEMFEAAAQLWLATQATSAFSEPVLYPTVAGLVAALIAEGEAPSRPDTIGQISLRVIDRMSEESLPDLLRAPAVAAAEAADAPTPPEEELTEGTYSELIDFTRCTDGTWTQDEDYWANYLEETAITSPLSRQLGQLSVIPTCVFWPVEGKLPPIHDGFPETIIVQSEVDALTPLERARVFAERLPNSSLIVVDNESAHGVFPYGADAVDRPVIDFLTGGDRPDETVVTQALPLRNESTTFESWAPLNGDATHDEEDVEVAFTDPFRTAGD